MLPQIARVQGQQHLAAACIDIPHAMIEYARASEYVALVPSPDAVKKSNSSKGFILRVSFLLFTLVATLSSLQKRSAPSTKFNGDEQISQYEQEFSLDGIDFDAPAPCGRHKCFFQLKGDDTVGYLVAEVEAKSVNNDEEESAASYSQVMDIGYQLAKYLEGEYAIRHFLMAPPQEIVISQPLGEKLNMNLYHPGTGKSKKKWADRFLDESSLVVQKVSVAPSPSAFIRNHPNTQKWIYDGFDDFLASVQHKTKFVKQFRKELNEAAKLIAKEPFYAKDFQALVDTSGRLYHIDFDVFKPQNKLPESIEELRRTSLQDLDKSGMSIEEWTRLATESFEKFLQHAESSISVNLR